MEFYSRKITHCLKNQFKMNRSSMLVVAVVLTSCLAAQFYFELTNDPNYPALISLSNVQYNVITSKQIDVSATVTIYEEINDGTNVKISVSPDCPYARMLNNIDVNLCTFLRKEWPLYARLIEASNGQFPDRCPIQPGSYVIQNLRLDLDRWPLLLRGFEADASIILHKNGRILTKLNVKGGVQL